MERILFDRLEKISEFEVDIRRVHEKSSNISMLRLKEGESLRLEKSDFQSHLAVLEGSVEMKVENKVEIFRTGCLVSVLPGLDPLLTALENSRILMIKDDPLWILRSRRSVRKYAKIDVPKKIVEKIISNSVLAPSAGNLQPWRIYAISDPEKKRKLAEASYGQEHVEEAPWNLVITAVPEESAREYGKRGRELYSIQDTAALATYITLSAKAFNLDTCWVGAFKENEVWRIIGSPEGEIPVAIITLGYGEESPEIPARKPISEILKFLERRGKVETGSGQKADADR